MDSLDVKDHYINIEREASEGRHRIGDTFELREDMYSLTVRAHRIDEELNKAFGKASLFDQSVK